MFKYMLFFAAGYWFGSGGKLPPKPTITTGADGSLIIGPPQANPSTQPYYPPGTQGQTWALPQESGFPAGSYIDVNGNVYSYDGRQLASGQQALFSLLQVR